MIDIYNILVCPLFINKEDNPIPHLERLKGLFVLIFLYFL